MTDVSKLSAEQDLNKLESMLEDGFHGEVFPYGLIENIHDRLVSIGDPNEKEKILDRLKRIELPAHLKCIDIELQKLIKLRDGWIDYEKRNPGEVRLDSFDSCKLNISLEEAEKCGEDVSEIRSQQLPEIFGPLHYLCAQAKIHGLRYYQKSGSGDPQYLKEGAKAEIASANKYHRDTTSLQSELDRICQELGI